MVVPQDRPTPLWRNGQWADEEPRKGGWGEDSGAQGRGEEEEREIGKMREKEDESIEKRNGREGGMQEWREGGGLPL